MKKTTLIIVMLLVIIFSALNIYLFTNKSSTSYTSISGYYLKEFPGLPFGLNISTIAFIIQWIVLLLVIIVSYSKFIQHKKSEQLKTNFHLIRKSLSKSSTDMDVFYNLLKEKKSLTIGTISKLFNITKEKAVEWAKILENHDLATIEYPAFSDPEVRIYEKKDEEQKNKEGDKTRRKEKEREQRGKADFKKGELPVPKPKVSQLTKEKAK